MHYNILYYSALHRPVIQCTENWEVQCTALACSARLCTAVYGITLQCTELHYIALPFTAVHGITLQCRALLQCRELQRLVSPPYITRCRARCREMPQTRALHCTLHASHWTLHTAHWTLHTEHYTLHTLHISNYTLHTAHCTLNTLNTSDCIVHISTNNIRHTINWTRSTAYCMLNRSQCTLQVYTVKLIIVWI